MKKVFINCLFGLLVPTLVSAQEGTVIGEAYDSSTKELLYVEQHSYVDGDQHQVIYVDPQGKEFASKRLRYGLQQQAPEFEQSNTLRGEWIQVTEQGDSLLVKYREKDDALVFDTRIKVTDHLLVDAGFDRYVKQHWDDLVLANQVQQIDYLVPSRLTTVEFRLGKSSCLYGTPETAVCFTITPTSWFVSLAVEPITVAYDPNTRNLLRFSGRGNIASSSGKYQTVDIVYRYPNS